MKFFNPYTLFILFVLMTSARIKAQYITVDTNHSVEQLVKDIFIGQQNNNCIAVSNISISGWDFGNNDLSYGYFNKGTSNFPISEGIILSTGKAKDAVGPNNFLQDAFASGWGGDADLIAILQQAGLPWDHILNATSLEFDFTAFQTDKISFEYMFLSEEYRPVNCKYSDAFAFLIKKANSTDPYTNIALVPGTTTPVTSLSINGATACPKNTSYFGGFNPVESPTNFNGETKVLKAETPVVRGQKYHIKLVIADHGDTNGRYDSAVFLKGGSFVGNKDLGPDRLLSSNNALCEGTSLVLNATTTGAQNYQWFRNGTPINGATQPTYTVTQPGFYEVSFDVSGCILKGNIRIEYIEKPLLQEITKTYCPSTNGGSISIELQNLNAEVEVNKNPDFIVKYYLNAADAIAGNPNFLPSNFSLSVNTTLYVRAENGSCVSDPIQPLHLKIGTHAPLHQVPDLEICDNDLDGSVEINLADYKNLFTTDPNLTVQYYASQQEAENQTNPIINPQVNFRGTATFYYRFEGNLYCATIGSMTFKIKSPKKSETLKDTSACPEGEALLDAGSGFDYYTWYNVLDLSTPIASGTTQSSVSVPIGDYVVDLQFNGCTYRQPVEVTPAEAPVITHIDVQGTSATVYVTGGTPPYLYALDGGMFQTSNVFHNIPRGTHTVQVKSADGCYVVEGKLIIINLINIITPNGDGINDTLDYSDLKIKDQVILKIFDRYGATLFESTTGNYIWNGKLNGNPVPTGTYWYILEWVEPGSQQKVHYDGWIMVKNRN